MATRVIAAQDKTSSGAGDDVQIKAGNANTSGAGGSIIIQPGAQATSGGDGIVIVRQPSGTAGTDEIQLLHNGSRGSIINKDGALQLGGANIAIRNVANNANTTLTATTLYATGIYSSNVINADGVTSDSYSWGIDDSSFNWNQVFNLRVGWAHIRGYANCGIAYTGNNTNGRRATLEVTDGSTGGGAWAYRSATTTVNTSYNNLNLAGHSAFQRLNATAATTITGIAPASTAGGSGTPTWIHTDGRIFWLYNVGTFNITLANESASSTAGNRVTTQTGANVVLGPGRMMQIVYDGTSSRWRTSGETYPYVFPTTDGTNGQVLTTNGSGTLSWTTVSSSSGTVTSVSGTGTVNGITLTGTVTSSGSLTLGGTLSGVSLATQVTGTLPIANGGTGTTTAQLAINALAGAVTSGSYLRGNGTNVVMAAIQAADVPTLNQNTTGTASGSVSGTASYLAKFTGTNVVGNSQIVDNGTSVGIGTSNPGSYAKIHCVISTAGNWPFYSQGATGNFGAGFYIDGNNAGQMLLADGTGTYKAQISSSGASYVTNSLGVGTSSPGAQLHVTTAAAATKGLIVKGVASQSANLTEWQDNTGAVVAAVSPTGAFTGSSFTPYGTFNSTTTIFGNNYWTPNYTGGVTSPSAGTYTKSTGSANVWNGQVYSSEGYTKNVYCAARASQTNGHIMFGLNNDPITDGNYSSLDYAWYFLDNATLMIYENNAQVATYGTYTTSTVLSITYDGSNVQYWKDGVIQRTVARSTGNPLYFDTSFYTLSSSLNSVQFGPIGQPFGISGTSGYLPKFTSQQTLGNSIVYDNGTNVGIGTASPTSKLDVSTGTGANFRAAFAATNQVEIGNYSAASGYREIAVAGSQVYFQTNTAGSAGVSTRMLIDPSGNVGIGTTSPGAKLEIQTADGADSLALSGYKTMKWESNNHLVFGGYTAGQWQVLKFYTNGSERVRVTSGGLVGIGTSTIAGTVPLADLHVNDPSGYGSLQLSQSPYGATIDTGGEIQFAATYRSAYDLTQVARIRGLRENATNNNWAGYLAFYTSTGTDNPSASTERMRINSSGNVGIGTTSPNMALHVVGAKAGDANEGQGQLNVESTAAYNATNGTVFSTSGAGGSVLFRGKYNSGGAVTGFAGIAGSKENTTDGHYGGNLRFYTRANGANDPPERMRIDASGNVGIGNASPGAKLQVDTGATGTKGQIIKAFLGQTANLSEWQNSTGTVLSAIDNNGRLVISSGGGTTSTPDLYLNNTSTTSPIIKWNSITGNPGMWFVSNNSIICKMYDNGIVEAGNTLAVQDMYLRAWSLQRASAGIISFNGSGPAISVGAGTLTTADSTMQITPPAASKKGLVVSGAALQTGNLQEWQNNSGTALAYMDASGNIITTSRVIAPVHSSSSSLQLWHADNTADSASNGISFGYSNWGSSYMPTNWTFKRTLPNTSGDYVELFSLPGQQASHFELTVVAYKHAEAFESKSYTFATQYLTGGGILQPTFSHSRNPGFAGFFGNHFEVELNTNVEPAVVRVRRTSTSGTNVAIFAYLRGMHISGITEKAGTGTSSISLSSLHGTQQVFPTVIAPPAVSSGAGNNIGLYAGNGVTSGAGGSIILQPGAQATSGGHGKVISRPGGSGQNYHEFQSSGGSTHVFVDYSGRLCITPEVNTTSMPVDCGLFVTPRQNANTIGLVVRGIASQAGNLQQWQNSAGTVLTSVDSVGRIGVETAPDSNYSVKAAGRIYAGNDIVTTAGLVTRSGAFDFTFGYGGPYLRRGYSSNGSTLYFGEDAAYQPAFDFSLGVAMPTIGVMRVTASAANTRALVLKAAASPTANLQEWQNSSGTALAYMDGNGNFAAVTKSFLIDHPTPAKAAEGKKLRYASLEGPENGVYYRGRLEGESEIVLPDYWKDLVDPESITVNLTARKFAQPSLFVVDANAERVVIESDRQICCDFTVFATRKDVAKLEVEPDGN